LGGVGGGSGRRPRRDQQRVPRQGPPAPPGEHNAFLNCHLAREVLLDAPPDILAQHVQDTWPCPAGSWVVLVGLRTVSLNDHVGTALHWDGFRLAVHIHPTARAEDDKIVCVRRPHVRYPAPPPPASRTAGWPWPDPPTGVPRSPPMRPTPPPPEQSGPRASADAWAGGPGGSASASASASAAASDGPRGPAAGRDTIKCWCGTTLPVLPPEQLIAQRGKLVNLGMMVLIRCWGGVHCDLQDRVIQCCCTTCPADAGWVRSASRIWRCPCCRRW
jgi:hypothetical protein